jgi:ribosomal protein S18 acetylase RimI-like enzyme
VQSTIRRIVEADVETVVAFSLAAWAPVFASLEVELGPEVYGAMFPDWRSVQASAVEAACTAAENDVWVAVVDEDATRAGEIHMIAVDPAHQGAGVGACLVQRAVTEIKARGVDLAVIATGGDPGHAPARALYEKLNFNALRQVRYYRKL